MINKTNAFAAIKVARGAHLKWLVYAQGLVEGIDCPAGAAPLSPRECEFGQWYYGEGRQVLGELASFQAIEAPHDMLHAIYHKVFDLIKMDDVNKAKSHMTGLQEMSKSLLMAIRFLEEEIDSLPPRSNERRKR